jgi:hypothetical protein
MTQHTHRCDNCDREWSHRPGRFGDTCQVPWKRELECFRCGEENEMEQQYDRLERAYKWGFHHV